MTGRLPVARPAAARARPGSATDVPRLPAPGL